MSLQATEKMINVSYHLNIKMGAPIILVNKKKKQLFLGTGTLLDGDQIIEFLRLIKQLQWDLDDVESPYIADFCSGASGYGGWEDDIIELGYTIINKQ